MHNEKSYSGTQNGSLATCHIGVVHDRAVWACTIAHTVWPLHCQLAPWKSNEVLFIFCGQRAWNLLKSAEEWRFSMETVVWLSLVWTYERIFAGPQVCRWRRGNGGGAKLVKGHARKRFSRGHPQACGQVDRVCCEAGGLCRKIRHKQFL